MDVHGGFLGGVFPAYAGMSPMVVPEWIKDLSFPRLRGDEPKPHNNLPPFYAFSPPTRG